MSSPRAPMRRVRQLFLILAILDFAALLAFLATSASDRTSLDQWVSTGVYAGMARTDGLDAAVTYAVVSTTLAHLILTGLFLWLAITLGRGRRATRIRATALLLISLIINVFMMTSALGGITQQIVMGISIVLKLAALWMLWFDQRTTAVYSASRPS
jgi:hypothetical protein